jgi:hypothetical protein
MIMLNLLLELPDRLAKLSRRQWVMIWVVALLVGLLTVPVVRAVPDLLQGIFETIQGGT